MSASSARYVWIDPDGTGRNRYALFRLGFELGGAPAGGELHVFADTRYRLMVNGVVAGHGPARFFTSSPEYDTYDLGPLLRPGPNALAIVVNSYGTISFHSEASIGGLIAWGRAADQAGSVLEIATDGSWRAMASPGHRPDTACLSFALGPGEFLDARDAPRGWELPEYDDSAWPHAVLQAHADHWGALRPRSIPMLDESKVLPLRRLGAWAAAPPADEDVYSLFVTVPGGRGLHTHAKVAVMTHLYSHVAQEVTLGAWWGRYWVNGREVQRVARQDVSLRQDFSAELREGWNTLLVYEAVKQDWWDFYLAVPRSAGVSVSAEKQVGSADAFLIGGPWVGEQADEADRMDLPLADPTHLPRGLGPWCLWPRDKSAQTPCRQRAWKVFRKISDDESLRVSVPALADEVGDGTLSLLLDFGTEVLGRPVVDFTAAAGTVVDLAYTERLKPDGTADVHYRFFVDMVERYVARDGAQTWQTFHPRGFRYLEVLVSGAPGGAGLEGFELHEVSLTRANYPVTQVGSFECSDPVLTKAWALGPPTLHACMEDAYLDCPWRERGLYTGDFFVEFFTNLAVYGDAFSKKLFRRCIELFLLGQGDNGLIPPCPHGLPPGRHPDYSAILAQCIWHYYARSGDAEFLDRTAEGLRKLLAGFERLTVPELGLVDGSSLEPYVDHAHTDREGLTCALNCFVQRAFHDGGRIMAALGRDQDADAYRARAESLAQAVRQHFWDAKHGVFVDRLKPDVSHPHPSVPANALPLLYGIASADQAPRALAWLADAMIHNFRVPEPKEHGDCNVSSYFAFYALGALFKHARAAEAQQFIRTCWGRMIDLGAWTCWEHMLDTDSRCHAWSTAPTHYLSFRALGVEFPQAGNPNIVRIRPQPGELQWARGVYPHPAGLIRVSWEIRDGRLVIDYDAPPGVQVSVDAGSGQPA